MKKKETLPNRFSTYTFIHSWNWCIRNCTEQQYCDKIINTVHGNVSETKGKG